MPDPFSLLAGGAFLGAGGSLASGILGSRGAKKARKSAKKQFKKLLQEFKRQDSLNRENLNPFINAGQQANKNLLGTATGDEVLDFRDTEGFRFRQEELERQIRRSQSARGSFFSGAAIEAEARGNLQLSDEENRFHTSILDSLAGRGVQAGAALGGVSANLFGSLSAASQNQSNLNSQLQLSQAQQLGQGISSATGIVGGTASGIGFEQFRADQFQTRGQSLAAG